MKAFQLFNFFYVAERQILPTLTNVPRCAQYIEYFSNREYIFHFSVIADIFIPTATFCSMVKIFCMLLNMDE